MTRDATIGYDQPLYVLPFDHRHSYGSEVFGFNEPMNAEQIAVVAASKQVIYEGFKQAIAHGVPREKSGILVDEEFGAEILRDAHAGGYITCMPVEKSGQHEFDFEYGDQFREHIESFDPTFTKVLVRYNPESLRADNERQLARLKVLSDWLHSVGRLLMFEMLVPAEKAQLAAAGSQQKYDLDMRPELMVRSIREIQDYGVDPDVWKIEGLDRHEDCLRIVESVQRDGREHVGSIVLGRGESGEKVVEWLQVAAAVPGFIGFAVGRSTFLQTIYDLRAEKIDSHTAEAQIAAKFKHWVSVFEAAKSS